MNVPDACVLPRCRAGSSAGSLAVPAITSQHTLDCVWRSSRSRLDAVGNRLPLGFNWFGGGRRIGPARNSGGSGNLYYNDEFHERSREAWSVLLNFRPGADGKPKSSQAPPRSDMAYIVFVNPGHPA